MLAPDVDARFRPRFYLMFGALVRAWTRVWFRYRLRGVERLPAGPVMFVGNHSAIGIADVVCMLGAWREAFGLSRRVVGMMHDGFIRPPLGPLCLAFGAVRASPDNARAAVARGHDVVVFPGGGLDACRPVHRPRDVVFGRRRGYVRLALERGLPIVPVATIGSHYTYLLLPGGELLGRLIRLRNWSRDHVVPVPVSALGLVAVVALVVAAVLPWWAVLAALVAVVVPNPVRVTSELLAPIDVCGLTAHIADPAARVERAHELVYGTLSAAVRRMEHEAPFVRVTRDVRAPARA